jgi:hypothetical protein
LKDIAKDLELVAKVDSLEFNRFSKDFKKSMLLTIWRLNGSPLEQEIDSECIKTIISKLQIDSDPEFDKYLENVVKPIFTNHDQLNEEDLRDKWVKLEESEFFIEKILGAFKLFSVR